MKLTLAFTILVAWTWTRSDAFMGLEAFNKYIKSFCGGRRSNDQTRELVNGQHLPIPNTIESFIGLVENLENLHPEWRPEDMVKILLLTFRYDDAIVNRNQVATRGSGGVGRYYEMLIQLFKRPQMGSQIRDADLTQDERCALYYMISHTVNSTVREKEDEVINNGGIDYPKFLREQGVLTLSSQTTHAFALGKVLLGILAGLERPDPASASQIFNEVKHTTTNTAPEFLEKVVISVLYAATFGDIVSITKEEMRENFLQSVDPFFYRDGFWGENVCPTHYLIENPQDFRERHATFSLIRGATDGYRLGLYVKEIVNSNTKAKLSQILRMYYSGQGFPDNRALSWCNRYDLKLNILQQEAINFDKLFSAVTDKVVDDMAVEQGVRKILDFLDAESSKIYGEATRDGNKCDFREAGMPCETPTHVMAILDMRSMDKLQEQSEIVGNLSSGINMGRNLASSVTVYTNLKPYGNTDQLDIALNRTTVSGCAGCAIKYYDAQRSGSESELEVFRDLSPTLDQIRQDSEEEYAVPAKVVLYFNYGSPVWETHLQRALNELRWKHRNVRLLAFGSRKESLRLFVDERDIETSMTPAKMDSLREKVCKVPALLQYHNCYRRDEAQERGEVFTGVITARHIQYWMMEPKYFLKSFNIKLIFRAISGEIRVCYSRDYSKIFDVKDPVGAQCQKSTGEEIVFTSSNPCHRYSESTCDPFYFFIEGKTAPREKEPCTEPNCRTLDQITYEFKHEGISCNGASYLLTKFSLILLLAMAAWKCTSVLHN